MVATYQETHRRHYCTATCTGCSQNDLSSTGSGCRYDSTASGNNWYRVYETKARTLYDSMAAKLQEEVEREKERKQKNIEKMRTAWKDNWSLYIISRFTKSQYNFGLNNKNLWLRKRPKNIPRYRSFSERRKEYQMRNRANT